MNWTLSAFTDEAGSTGDVQITAAQQAGLKYIDLRSLDGHNVSELPLTLAMQFRQSLDATGLSVQMLGSPLGKIDITDDFSEIIFKKLEHLSQVGPVLGCQWVRIFSYYNKAGRPLEEWKTESMKRLTALRERAHQLGLVLYHENERHIYGDLCDGVVEIASLRHDAFKLIFDFDNYNQSGEDVWANWQRLSCVTDSFHLKDSRAENGTYSHVPIGEGDGQAERILADALERGWSGPLAIEPHLSHSGAVAKTNASGQAGAAYKEMSAAQSFALAAAKATELLQKLGVPVL